MKFEIHNESLVKDFGISVAHLQNMLASLTQVLSRQSDLTIEVKQYELGVIFSTADEIQNLNAEFRELDEVTDVLSFKITDEVGEIYVCPEYIKTHLLAESGKEDISTHALVIEIVRMIIHGVLHIAGFDHAGHFGWDGAHDKEDVMYTHQEQILTDVLKSGNEVVVEPDSN